LGEIENILSSLEIIFKVTKLKHVIVGGIAVIHYGHIRATQESILLLKMIIQKLLNLWDY